MTLKNAFWRFNVFGNIRKLGIISDHLGEHQIIKPYAFYLRLLNNANDILKKKQKGNKLEKAVNLHDIVEKKRNLNMLGSLFKVFVKAKNKGLTENAVKYLAKLLDCKNRMNNRAAFDRIRNYKIWSNPLRMLERLSVYEQKRQNQLADAFNKIYKYAFLTKKHHELSVNHLRNLLVKIYTNKLN
jgi:hypothetical protein